MAPLTAGVGCCQRHRAPDQFISPTLYVDGHKRMVPSRGASFGSPRPNLEQMIRLPQTKVPALRVRSCERSFDATVWAKCCLPWPP